MPNINVKLIKEKVIKMLAAWLDGAVDVVFMGVKREDLVNLETRADTLEGEIENIRSQLKMKEEELADVYVQMNQAMVDVGNGVRGDKNFGDDSALYGAMGFVRKSERKSGLTRKKSKS